nr:hypothetical protein [Lachnospiraceae bacterium]
MDEGLGIALIVIAAIALIFAVVKIVSSRKEDSGDSWSADDGRSSSGPEPVRPTEPASKLGGSLARYWQVKEQEEQDQPGDNTPSLDEAFARANRKWVCPQCELMHPNEERACRICGYIKS